MNNNKSDIHDEFVDYICRVLKPDHQEFGTSRCSIDLSKPVVPSDGSPSYWIN